MDNILDSPILYSGTKYKPYTHRQITDLLNETLDKEGVVINDTIYNFTKNGSQLVARYGLENIDDDMGFEISFKNSLDGSMSFGICSGSKIYICKNGQIFGDAFIGKRKHIGNSDYDITEMIKKAVFSYDTVAKHHIEIKHEFSNREITKETINYLVGDLLINQDILKMQQLSVLKKELNNSTFDYKAEGSLYEFYNHCTYALKDSHPSLWHKNHVNIYEYLKIV